MSLMPDMELITPTGNGNEHEEILSFKRGTSTCYTGAQPSSYTATGSDAASSTLCAEVKASVLHGDKQSFDFAHKVS